MYDGVIVNETPGAITLRGGSEDGDEIVLRKNIAEIRASSVSLMPEGFEQEIARVRSPKQVQRESVADGKHGLAGQRPQFGYDRTDLSTRFSELCPAGLRKCHPDPLLDHSCPRTIAACSVAR
jgi:hypothetical protein